jgi:hypothetical protein
MDINFAYFSPSGDLSQYLGSRQAFFLDMKSQFSLSLPEFLHPAQGNCLQEHPNL